MYLLAGGTPFRAVLLAVCSLQLVRLIDAVPIPGSCMSVAEQDVLNSKAKHRYRALDAVAQRMINEDVPLEAMEPEGNDPRAKNYRSVYKSVVKAQKEIEQYQTRQIGLTFETDNPLTAMRRSDRAHQAGVMTSFMGNLPHVALHTSTLPQKRPLTAEQKIAAKKILRQSLRRVLKGPEGAPPYPREEEANILPIDEEGPFDPYSSYFGPY